MINQQPLIVKTLAFSISAVCFALGLTALLTEFVPESWTRFGLTAALRGEDAKLYGAILILLSCLPLLMFCKSAKQAATLGSILFIMLMVAIFGGIYLL